MRSARSSLTLAALLASTVPALAQDIALNRPGSGARAAGMGNAFIAVSDDGTAASWNPAGLSQLRKPEFSLVYNSSRRELIFEGYRTRDESAAFTSISTTTSTSSLEFASAAIPFTVAGKPVTLQAGWRRLYQIASHTQGDVRRVPAATATRPEAVLRIDNSDDGTIDLWSLAGAVRLTTRLSAGWNVDLYRGGWEDRASVSEDPGVLGPTDFTSAVQSHGVSGNALTLGLLLAYPSLRIGVVYHGDFWGDLEDSLSVRSSLADPVEASGRPAARLHLPVSIGVGVAWRPRPLLRIAFDATYDQWTQFLVDGAAGLPDRVLNLFDALPPELSATRDTVSLNAGMEKLFPVKDRYVPLRLGAALEPQGPRDPLVRDGFDHLVLSAGTGLNTNSVKLDVAVEYRWGGFRNTRSFSPVYLSGRAADFGLPPAPEAEGTARIQQWRVTASVIYRVTNTAKVKDALKKAFGS